MADLTSWTLALAVAVIVDLNHALTAKTVPTRQYSRIFKNLIANFACQIALYALFLVKHFESKVLSFIFCFIIQRKSKRRKLNLTDKQSNSAFDQTSVLYFNLIKFKSTVKKISYLTEYN